jgi:hypothetical protein
LGKSLDEAAPTKRVEIFPVSKADAVPQGTKRGGTIDH